MKTVFILVIAAVLLQQAWSQNACTGSYEIYNECGSACPLTCDNYKNQDTMCTMQCVVGCFCEEGYVRNSDGNCCLPTDCEPEVSPPTSCSLSHEEYKECGSACPLTCDNYNNTTIMCTEQCVPGCYCEEGYVRNSDGNCCLPNDCKPEVSPPTSCTLTHEKYTTCGSACPITCDNYKDQPTICTRECVVGCFCDSGYVRESDGSCVLPLQCKPKVIEPRQPSRRSRRNRCRGVNEIYKRCGTLCPKTCSTKDVMFKCQDGCQRGCFCADGYLRNSKNQCVLVSSCD